MSKQRNKKKAAEAEKWAELSLVEAAQRGKWPDTPEPSSDARSLVREIEQGLGGIPTPSKQRLFWWDDIEIASAESELSKCSWKGVSPKVLREIPSFELFTPIGLRFILPAAMSHSLLRASEMDVASDYLIAVLNTESTVSQSPLHELLLMLTKDQKRLVYRWLRLMRPTMSASQEHIIEQWNRLSV